MPTDPDRLAANLAEVRHRITEACQASGRDSSEVRLIAVTKEQAPDVIDSLIAAGVCDFGENRIEHLELMRSVAPRQARFHFIGRVQGRHLAKLAPHCVAIHSLCEADHIDRLARACAARSQRMVVFLQVNVADDMAKAGISPTDLAARIEQARVHAALDVVGLMTMAPLAADGGQADSDTVRRCFAKLRELAHLHRLPRLSMGMSHDFELAIIEGATDVRVGSRLFC
jgi:PLP dependent protein